MDKIKTPATRITDAELNELLREVVKDEILKDARPTLESLKSLHADRPLLFLALSRAIEALTERDALRHEVEAARRLLNEMGAGTVIFASAGAMLRGANGKWYTDQTGVHDTALEAFAALEGDSK